MQQLSGLDALFLHAESAARPLHIGGMAIYDQSDVPGGALRFKDVLDHVRGRVHLSDVFRRKLARAALGLRHPHWVDDPDFDVEFHVRHVALPEPRDRRQLNILGARLHSRSIDRARPLWEWWVIEGLDRVEGVTPGSFAIFFKIHHAAVDGIAGREMIDVVHDRAAQPEGASAPTSWEPDPGPSRMGMVASTLGSTALQPIRLARTVFGTIPIVREMVMRGLDDTPFLPPGAVPRTRLNGTVTAARVHDSCTFSLDDLRRIKAAVPHATINDVVLSIVGGAMRGYLIAHDDLPEGSLISACPISIRPDSAARAGGTQVSVALVSLATDTDDPLARLREVHRSMSSRKEFTHAVSASVLTDYAQYMPGALTMLAARAYTKAALANRHRPMMNTLVTNVPGWREPLYFAGARLVCYDPYGPVWDGMGLIHPVVSYLGDITIAFDGARNLLPDPEFYRGCIQASFGALAIAAAHSAKEAKPSSKRRSSAKTPSRSSGARTR